MSTNSVRRVLGWRSLRARVAILIACAVGLAVALAAVAAYFTVRNELQDNLDRNLLQRAHSAATSPLSERIADIPPAAIGAADIYIARVSDVGEPSSAGFPQGLLGAPEVAVAAGQTSQSVRTETTQGVEFRVVAVPMSQGFALVLAKSTDEVNRELHTLAWVLFWVGVGGMVVGACVGLVIARAGLRPVDRLIDATERIASTRELRPIPVEGDDELARLTSSFNEMLVALADSQERQRQLVGDAGHELRTPLTSLRTNIDLLTQAARDDAPSLDPREHDELLTDVRAQLEELTALVGDLVELARTDPTSTMAEYFDLAEVVSRATERVRRRAPGLRLDVTTQPWIVFGDATGLERAAINLLDNAAKWSPPDSTVTVTLSDGILQVADEGPGIAEDDLPYVFDRFYRAADARGLPGSGLGLAIVRQAAERHGGSVGASTAPGGGAVLVVRIPGQPPSPKN